MVTLSARFVRALRALENEIDLQSIVQLFSEDCELTSPLAHRPVSGTESIRRYWRQYLDSFRDIRTEVVSVFDGDNMSTLEWISSATLPDGRPVEFSGVTLLRVKDNRIASLHSYFDARPLLEQHRKDPVPFRSAGRTSTKKSA